MEFNLICYADDSTLMGVVPSPWVRIRVVEFLNLDLCKVSEWCDLWGMKLNACKTKTMKVFRSHTLTSGRTVLKKSDDFIILGVIFDSKMTFNGCYTL